MLINKEGKFFGKISIIDILVIAAIILLGVGLFVKFGTSGTNLVASTNEKIEYTLQVDAVRMYTVEALQGGGPVSDATTKEEMGKIVDVTYEPAQKRVDMADGTFQMVVIPEEYDVTVTVEVEGKVSDKGFYTKGNKFLAAGSSYTINSKYAQASCYIGSIKGI